MSVPNRWAKRGQVKAPVTQRPARPTSAPAPPPVSSGAKPKPECTDCGSTTRKLIQVSPKVLLCTSDIRNRKKTKKLKGRETRQLKSFGITLEEESRILAIQGGGCICAPWTGYRGQTRALSTDHDHKTGVIRGKLCKHCNDLLGRVRDDPRYFAAMMSYLMSPPAVQVLGERIAPEGSGQDGR